jgi:site-specific recombinase XerD
MSVESKQEQEAILPDSDKIGRRSIYPITEGVSPKTGAVYQRYFNRFLKHIQITDLQVLLDFNQKVIKEMIIDYCRQSVQQREVKRSSIKTQIAAILHFFHLNNDDFNLTTNNFRMHLPPDESAYCDRPYTTAEIAQVITSCDLRTKAVVLLLCSSGMRIGALPDLRIGDLTKIPECNLYKIQVYARSKKDRYYAFCTPECAAALNSYLDYRKRYGESLTKETSPLIREQFNGENPFTINAPKFISVRGVEYMIMHALKISGIRKPKEVHLSHGFRKFFKSQAESSAMKSINIELLMGHNIGVSGHYYRPTEQEVLEDYLKAVDMLTIDPTQRLQKQIQRQQDKHSAEWLALKQEMHKLKREMIRFRPWGEKNLPRQEFEELLREEYEEKRKAKEGSLF